MYKIISTNAAEATASHLLHVPHFRISIRKNSAPELRLPPETPFSVSRKGSQIGYGLSGGTLIFNPNGEPKFQGGFGKIFFGTYTTPDGLKIVAISGHGIRSRQYT